MMRRNNYLLVPIELCKYCVTNNIENSVYTLIEMKRAFGESLERSKENMMILASVTKSHERTVYRHINVLKKYELIFSTKKRIEIYSWKKILQVLETDYNTGVKCYPKSIIDPKCYFGAALITKLVNERRQNTRREENVQKTEKRALKTSSSSLYQPVAHRALSKICNISLKKAHNIKRRAFYHKHLFIKKSIKPIVMDGGTLQLNRKEVSDFKRVFPEYHTVILDKSGNAFTRGPDRIKSLLKLKYSRNY